MQSKERCHRMWSIPMAPAALLLPSPWKGQLSQRNLSPRSEISSEWKGGLRFVRAKEDESSALWEQRLLALWVEELHGLLLLLLPAWARVVLCIWVVAHLSAAHTAHQSLGGENEHREDNWLAREGKSLQHRLKAFYFCFLLSFYLLFLMWLAGLPLFCGHGAECWWKCGIHFRGSTCRLRVSDL